VTSQQPWEDVVAAESAYIEARTRLFAADAETQLSLALASPSGRGTALRILRDSPIELVMAVLPALFRAATSTHAQVGLARNVLGRIDSGWLSTALIPMVDSVLANESSDWSDYRRLAEVLADLGQQRLLVSVVERAAQSADEDIREVAEDFRRG
jgi:hypothetical protein